MAVEYVNSPRGAVQSLTYYWSIPLLEWTEGTQPAGGGGGGGAATIADGADVTQGAISDAAVTTNATGTISGKLRGLVALIASVVGGGGTTYVTTRDQSTLVAKKTTGSVFDEFGTNDGFGALVIRQDAPGDLPLSIAEGSFTYPTTDASGRLWVNPSSVTQPTTSNEDRYTLKLDYAGGPSLIYLGAAAPGTATSAASWQIKRFSYDGSSNVSAIEYGGSTRNFNQIWDNRAALTYS